MPDAMFGVISVKPKSSSKCGERSASLEIFSSSIDAVSILSDVVGNLIQVETKCRIAWSTEILFSSVAYIKKTQFWKLYGSRCYLDTWKTNQVI
jgi:hypothetical protein